jgi:agmatine deiminase
MSKYYLPAEWHKQYAVQITWPHANTDWQDHGNLTTIQQYFVTLAEAILNYQNLIIVADNLSVKQNIEQLLNKNYNFNYNIYIAPTNDTWARDHSAITLVNQDKTHKNLILDFEFNAWGGKFNFEHDNLITGNIYKQHAFNDYEYKKYNYILEGGSIDTDGLGTVLTTKSCILNTNRNHGLSDEQKISKLKEYLNITNLIVLHNSFLYGDDTDGHIDMIARFCNENTIVYTACDDPNNLNYEHLQKLEQELKEIEKYLQREINLVPLYIPSMIYNHEQELLPASYVNFLIINNAVLVPTYNDSKYDELALNTFKKLFPNRDIIGIDSVIAIKQGGSLHCLTMQIPS